MVNYFSFFWVLSNVCLTPLSIEGFLPLHPQLKIYSILCSMHWHSHHRVYLALKSPPPPPLPSAYKDKREPWSTSCVSSSSVSSSSWRRGQHWSSSSGNSILPVHSAVEREVVRKEWFYQWGHRCGRRWDGKRKRRWICYLFWKHL